MILGFTGTQNGMTPSQLSGVRKFFHDHIITEIYHGGCVGSDAEFDEISRGYFVKRTIYFGSKPATIHMYPQDVATYGNDNLFRNRLIVAYSDWLLATPKQIEEPSHTRAGGTWYTVRYAKGLIPITIIWPNGETTVYDEFGTVVNVPS